ncbi:MAG TPA: glycosyltransferase [Clostridiales bacterium]|nr:glycosyltransferase [Clostridiales bacterium]
MLKVLHLLNYLGNGGSEKYIFSLAKKLHGKSCRFYIAYSEDGPGRSMFEELGIDLIPLKMNSPFDLKAALQLKKLCRQLSIDVIHTHFLRENYISVMSRIAGNRVGIINTRHMLFENSWPVVLTNRFFTMFNSRIIAVSLHVMERLIMEGISKNRIALIYNGVDTTEWDCSVSSSFRKEAGIPEEDMLITSVSRFSPEKGHDFIIDVIGYMKDNRSVLGLAGKKYRFVLAGSGPLHGAIIEKAKARGLQDDIIFPGYVENVRELLKDSDIFIAHSQNEALGIAILEAMAAGLPVITTDSGGTAEIVDGNGQNGILVRYGDVQGYAEGIALLINDIHLRRKYADNGLKVVRERFSLDKTAAETYNLYELSRKGEKDDR